MLKKKETRAISLGSSALLFLLALPLVFWAGTSVRPIGSGEGKADATVVVNGESNAFRGIPLIEKRPLKSNKGEFQVHVLWEEESLVKNLLDRIEKEGVAIWKPEGQSTNAKHSGRDSNMQQFKPNVDTIFFIFSDRKAVQIFEYPWYKKWKDVLHPLLQPVFEAYGLGEKCIVRLQLAKMNPGSIIRVHSDRGMWVKRSHRIHVVLKVPRETKFEAACQVANKRSWCPVRLKYCEAFEINNVIPHRVENPKDSTDRIHLIVDLGEVEHERTQVSPGASLPYY